MITDPIEIIVAAALDAAGVRYVTGDQPGGVGLDFYLPDLNLHIEVKQFHSPRIAEQMSRAGNVIAIQGEAAARWFAAQIRA